MTGKEAKDISDQLQKIAAYLIEENDKLAFYGLGRLIERLEQIVEIDKCSFNSTVSKDDL